jgi:hypothetical protein
MNKKKYMGLLRLKKSLLPDFTPGQRALYTPEFDTKETAEAHCNSLMSTGQFTLYRVLYRLEENRIGAELTRYFTDTCVETEEEI